MEKYIEDGMKAVLVSKGFGAGWSTWNSNYAKELATDKRIVEYVMNYNFEESEDGLDIEKFLEGLGYHNVYIGGFEDLQVEWLDEDEEFYIEEYDGSESLVTKSDGNRWLS